jgi:hypothetical protein
METAQGTGWFLPFENCLPEEMLFPIWKNEALSAPCFLMAEKSTNTRGFRKKRVDKTGLAGGLYPRGKSLPPWRLSHPVAVAQW